MADCLRKTKTLMLLRAHIKFLALVNVEEERRWLGQLQLLVAPFGGVQKVAKAELTVE